MQIITKSKDVFQVRVFLGRDQNGKIITKTKTFHCKKKEIKKLAISYEEEVKALNTKQTTITLVNMLKIYLANRTLTPKSYYSIETHYRLYIFPFFSQDQDLKDITLAQGQTFILWLKAKSLANITINSILTSLKTVLNYAVICDILDFNPLAKLSKLPIFRQFKQTLDRDELKKLLELADKNPKYFFLRLAIVTGARPEEYLCLEWTDIDFESGNVKIEKVAVNVGERTIRKGAKNASSVRMIPLDKSTLKILKSRAEASKSKYILPAVKSDNYLAQSSAFCRLQRAAKLCGIEKKVNLYLLRHSHATILIQNGAPISEVSRRLGHANIHTTFSYYVHTTTEGAVKTAKLFGDLMDI